jgi:hypothetical protein
MKTTKHFFFPSLPIFLTFLTLLFATAAQAQVPSYVSTNGLVGWWPFNGNANNEFNLSEVSIVNGPQLSQDRFGLSNSCYSFNGVSDDIVTGSYGVQGTGISISFWYKTSQQAQNNYMISWGGNEWASFFEILNNHWSAETIGPCYAPSLNGGGTLISKGLSTYPSENDWHHCVVILPLGAQSLNDAKFYFDDVELLETCSYANYGAGVPNISETNLMKFGSGYQQGWATNFEGLLDDIGVWNRELTESEVAELFNVCNVTLSAISGNVTPTQFTQETYIYPNTAGSTYNWYVTNGVIVSGQGTNSIDVMWANTGIGQISVAETNATNCTGDVVNYDVVVIPTNVEELSNQLILYPNPVTTELNLQITSDLIGTDLFVFDALGKQILKQQILSTNTTINTSSFAVGSYVVKVVGGVKKFAVVK